MSGRVKRRRGWHKCKRPPSRRRQKICPSTILIALLSLILALIARANAAGAQNETISNLPLNPLIGQRDLDRQVSSLIETNDSERRATPKTNVTTTTNVKLIPKEAPAARRRPSVKSSDARARPAAIKPAKEQVLSIGKSANGNRINQNNTSNLWRPTKSFRLQRLQNEALQNVETTPDDGTNQQQQQQQSNGGLQVSITPRVSLVRVPVESNTILKCLISAQSDNFTRPFKIRWSRFMYDENVYEQIESSAGFDESSSPPQVVAAEDSSTNQTPANQALGGRGKRDDDSNHLTAPGDGQQVVADRQQQLRDFLARSHQETNVISNILIEATLSINSVKVSDNASYFCTATESGGLSALDQGQNQARIDLVALSKPVVRLESIRPARDSKSALVQWLIVSDGNTPITRTILMVHNDSRLVADATTNRHDQSQQQTRSDGGLTVLDEERNQWRRIEVQGDGGPPPPAEQPNLVAILPPASGDVDVTSISRPSTGSHHQDSFPSDQNNQLDYGATWRPGRWQSSASRRRQLRAFNLSSLLPGVTYQLRLAAINDMGQSEYSQLQTTMPNEIPAQISDIVPLSTTNDSITIGWRRPPYDQAKTIRYELQLFDLNRTLTLDANTNTNHSQTGPMRTNFMFHFVNLNPGTDYHFQIRACSRAGCSAYSSPRLLVSTQDGEPDEPLDVELSCQLNAGANSSSAGGQSTSTTTTTTTTNQLIVSWLPPVNPHGRLLNYSVHIESSASYLNHSGQWTSDQWRTVMDTGDNHTLSLEASNLLQPNTNYSVRVCANNRLKRCGRLSQSTNKSRCSTPSELPSELPTNIQLASIRLQQNQDQPQFVQLFESNQQPSGSQQTETLVLELPFISLRNGSIDCIQIVLVKLPEPSPGGSAPDQHQLPSDPGELPLRDYFDWAQQLERPQQQPQADSPVAYLAEELDSVGQSGAPEELARGSKRVYLGDGQQNSCKSLWARLRKLDLLQQADRVHNKWPNSQTSKSVLRAIDGPLLAQTHYTGFLKLIQVRPLLQVNNAAEAKQVNSIPSNELRLRRQIVEGTQFELVTKFSDYFSPVKTAKVVPEVPISSLAQENSSWDSLDQNDQTQSQAGNDSICAHSLVQLVQKKLNATSETCLKVTKFADTARKRVAIWLSVAQNYLGQRFKFVFGKQTLANGADQQQQQQHIATMQPLEIGLILIISTLFIMFVIYLLLLPSRLSRKRKRKMRRQLQGHEKAILQQQQQEFDDQTAGFMRPPQGAQSLAAGNGHEEQWKEANGMLAQDCADRQQQQQQNSLATSLGYQTVTHQADVHQHHQSPQHQHLCQQTGAGSMRRLNQECPVHSSPMSQVFSDHQQLEQENEYDDEHDRGDEQDETMKVNGRQGGGGPASNGNGHHDHDLRRQSVHVCQPTATTTANVHAQRQHTDTYAHNHHNHHHHHQQQQQQQQHRHNQQQANHFRQQQHHQSAYQLNNEHWDEEHDHQHDHQHNHHQHHQQHNHSAHHQPAPYQQEVADTSCRTMVTRRHQPLADDFGGAANYGYKTLHNHHNHHHHQQQQQNQHYASNQHQASCQQNSNYATGSATLGRPGNVLATAQLGQTMSRQQNNILALAKKINKSIPLSLFQSVMELRLKHNWLREEYEQLPKLALLQQQRQQQTPGGATSATTNNNNSQAPPAQDVDGRHMKLRPQLIVSRDDSVSALIIGNHQYDASLIKLQVPVAISGGGGGSCGGGGHTIEKQFICAKSPVDPNTVWDFWRLVYEKEVSTLVMLTPNEDAHTGELRCAQYWPTCDNEITTILSPRNESVAQSKWPLAKFKICQETLNEPESEFVIRRLTLLVMATKAGENDPLTSGTTTNNNDQQQDAGQPTPQANANPDQFPPAPAETLPRSNSGEQDENQDNNQDNQDQEDEVIVERNLLHFQFLHWNASNPSNQMKLIKFIELVNEKHAQLMQQQASPCANGLGPQNPILVHCANGIGRSGLFAAMSFVIDDLSYKLATMNASLMSRAAALNNQQQQQVVVAKLNLFQLVSRLRNNRDMLLSPYRFYELLYQLTAKCIPGHISNQDQ